MNEMSRDLNDGIIPVEAMKRQTSSIYCGAPLRWLAALALLSGSLLSTGAAVYETADEFTAGGDFDGDGRADVVVVDKATGNFRIAYQLSAGQHTWSASRGSGIEAVSGFSVGRLLTGGRDALAFTAPDANRVNVLEAASAGAPASPTAAFPGSIGPNLVVAIDIGGAGNTALHDLFVGSIANSGLLPNQANLLRDNAGSFSSFANNSLTAPTACGDVVRLKTGAANCAGMLLRGGGGDTFRAYDLSGGAFAQAVQLSSLPTNCAFIHANFNASPLVQFLFYQPGETNGVLWLRPITEPSPGIYSFGSETPFTFGEPIRAVSVLAKGTTAQLLIVFGGGETAGVYDFDGVNPPVAVQELDAPPGEYFSGALPFANGNFMTLTAPIGTKSSSHFQTYNSNGQKYAAGQSGSLPALTALSSSANIFQFETEPFVSGSPNLLRTLNAGDWTSQFNNAALPQLSATVESFAGPGNGLDNPAPTSLGTANPLTHFGLVNQYVAPISLFSVARPMGDEVADVKISPPAGLYKAGVKLSFTATPAGAQIYYRFGSGSWNLFNNTPVAIFQGVQVSYYAQTAGNAKSAIHHAAYQFENGPDTLDSDADGVPDFVEIAKGLDPKKGADSDGDGYTDLEELLQGTDPKDGASVPGSHLESKAGFDLIQTPRPLDGSVNALTTSQTNTAVRAYALSGSLLAYAVTENLNLPVQNPAAMLSNIVIDAKQRLMAVATEQHFDISTASSDTKIGRELLGLIAVPNVSYKLDVAYKFSGGKLGIAANEWIASAQAAQNALKREKVMGELTMFDTLAALLVEKKVAEALGARGFGASNTITLFPFRPTDGGRDGLAKSTLLALETYGTNGEPAYLLWSIYCSVTNAISIPTPFNAGLREVTSEIYRISSVSNNAAPGKYASPVDSLREFLSNGTLHSNYLAETTMTPAALAGAYQSIAPLLEAIPQRPTTNVNLQVRADTFSGNCTLLDTVAEPTTTSLYFANGQPYRLLENFNLPVASHIHVFGYSDVAHPGCGDDGIEVIALSLDSVPAVSATDSDSDLLPDEWEMLMFGGLGQNGSGDFDGDGISNLQEFLDHTDSKDGLSKSALAQNVTPPQIDVQATADNQLKLTWVWPSQYAGKVKFEVQSTESLDQPFVPAIGVAQHMGGSQFEMTLPNPGSAMRLYRLQLSLH